MSAISATAGMSPRVAVIVLNWERPADTIACLDSLLDDVCSGLATVVCCDNGSTDDSVARLLEWAQQRFDALEHGAESPAGFILIQTGANLGYAAGNNAGIRYALDAVGADFLWILNNDTVVEPGALHALVDMADGDPSLGAVGSTLVERHHPEVVQCAGGCRYYPAFTVMRPALAGLPLSVALAAASTPRLSYVAGAAMLLRAEAVRRVGLLNETFFLYYEEADYANRLHREGYRIGWCRRSVVRHGAEADETGDGERAAMEWTASYHENLSTLKFTVAHHRALLPFAALFRLLGKVLVLVLQRRWRGFPPLWAAYRDFFLFGTCHAEVAQGARSPMQIVFRGRNKA